MTLTEPILTVSQLNGYIRDVLNMGFPQSVWICGEIQGFNRNKDKTHVFFDICEKDPASKDVLARIGVVIFANRKAIIAEILKSQENAFELRDDIEVKLLCKVDFYPPHGAVRLIVESVDPVYTLGKIAQEKQRLIALLKSKGILDKNKSVAWPLVPLRIGLITSYDSAAYNDFLSELRQSGFGFQLHVLNTLMQGKGAETQVCSALEYFNKIDNIDLIVITRGGGSLADLSCFDSQSIAEKIAQSRLPVLSGIGHEINITITDLAAHTFQKTPTAVAQFIVTAVKNFLTQMEDKVSVMIRFALDSLEEEKKKLKTLARALASDMGAFLKSQGQQMDFKSDVLLKGTVRRLAQAKTELKEGTATLLRAADQQLRAAEHKMVTSKRLIEMVRPQNTLKRGFSITKDRSGKLIRSCQDVAEGDFIQTMLEDGVIDSKVLAKKEGI